MIDQVATAQKWGPIILRAYITLVVLSTASVVIRIVAKLKTKAKLGLDDVFIIAGLVLWYAEAGVDLYAVHVGERLVTMFDPEYSEYVKFVIISGLLYAPTVLCISVSVLMFYRRVFPIESTKRWIKIFLGLHILWAFACFFGSMFICYPMELAWAPLMVQAQPENATKCMKYPMFFISITSLELGLNAAVLLMPIKQVIGLKLNLQTRLMLAFVFLLGGVSIISGAVRIQQTYVPGEPTVDLAGDMFWMGIHVNTALIAASLPVYRPLMRATMGFMSSTLRKVYGSGYDSKRSGDSSGNKVSEGYSTISDKQSQKSLFGEQNSMDPIDRQIDLADMEPKRAHIQVQRGYEVV